MSLLLLTPSYLYCLHFCLARSYRYSYFNILLVISIIYIFIFFYFLLWHFILYVFFFFFSSRRRHTRCSRDWSSDVCSSDLFCVELAAVVVHDRPDRSDWYAADVEWNQQAFFACGNDRQQVGVAALSV